MFDRLASRDDPVINGLLVLVFSLAYLRMKGKEGLVTSGPYRLVRHPQYSGITLSTIGFTSWSIWVLMSFYGVGFLTPRETVGVWFVELLAYILLSYVEELYLSRGHGESFENYRNKVPSSYPLSRPVEGSLRLSFRSQFQPFSYSSSFSGILLLPFGFSWRGPFMCRSWKHRDR